MNVSFYRLDRQYANLKDELLDATDKALKEGTLVNGQFTYELESWLAKRTNCRYALTVHSGTQALEIMARAINIDSHDHHNSFRLRNNVHKPQVCIPDLTYVATLNAFLNAGYNPILVDVDKNGLLNRDKESFRWLYCTVGLYGAPAPHPETTSLLVDTIVDGAQHWLIEDNPGIGMTISFDPTKNLNASGNGGAIVTNDFEIYEKAVQLKNNGKNSHELVGTGQSASVLFAGTNSKMSELDCAHVLVRTRYLDQWQTRRRQIRLHYLDQFKDLPFRCFSRGFEKHADQKFAIYVGPRNELNEHLQSCDIQTRIHYAEPLSSLPISQNLEKPSALSSSNMLAAGSLSLPIYPELTDIEVEYVCDSVRKFFT
jgi:dTDP-4-amino-4,6-dideoxygalactose transaminase